MALYQKYRPKSLTDLVGQEFVRQTLESALKSQQVSHAYLFFGSRGTGKTSTARILAKALNCQNPTEAGGPCNECEFCTTSDAGSFVDLIEIDGASNRKIEHARALIEKINFAPTLGKRKVYIIDEVHMLTKEAFNALLKTIEEPPEHAYFLLATTEIQKVPETIRSRCQTFTFHRFTPQQIAGRLQEIADREGISVPDREALLLIANKSRGGLRDAIGLFEQASAAGVVSVEHLQKELGLASKSQLEDFFGLLVEKNAARAIEFIGEISSEGLSLDDFLEQLLGFLREKMLQFSVEEKNPDLLSAILGYIENFDFARRAMRDASIPTLPIEIAIIKTTELVEGISKEKKDGGWHLFGKKDDDSLNKEKKEKEKEEKNESKGIEKKPPVEKKEEEKTEDEIVSQAVALTAETLQENWGKILDTLDDGMLRAALGQSSASVGKENSLKITFSADSWKKQVEEANRFQKLLAGVQNIFGPQINIVTEVQSVILQPIEKKIPASNGDDEAVTDPSVISEIFGSKSTS